MELSSPKLKKKLIITCKAQKSNKKFARKKFIVSCDVFVILSSERSVFFIAPFIIPKDLPYLKSKYLQ